MNETKKHPAPRLPVNVPVMPPTGGYDMPPVFDQLLEQFCKKAAQEREWLAEKLLAMGYDPCTVTIYERTWYDEENYTMRFECWPVLKA